jgi:hypothetical protein
VEDRERSLRERAGNALVAVAVVALLLGGAAVVAVLWADHLTLQVHNAGPAAVTVSGCGDPVGVPAGRSVVATRVCWRALELQARDGAVVVDRVAVPRSGAYVYDVGGRGGLLLVDYSAAYAQANEYALPPDAEAKVAADLSATRLVPLQRAHAVLDVGAALPSSRLVGSKVFRLEKAPAPPLDAAALKRHFTERMREELTPESMRPVRLDFRAPPKDPLK